MSGVLREYLFKGLTKTIVPLPCEQHAHCVAFKIARDQIDLPVAINVGEGHVPGASSGSYRGAGDEPAATVTEHYAHALAARSYDVHFAVAIHVNDGRMKSLTTKIEW